MKTINNNKAVSKRLLIVQYFFIFFFWLYIMCAMLYKYIDHFGVNSNLNITTINKQYVYYTDRMTIENIFFKSFSSPKISKI